MAVTKNVTRRVLQLTFADGQDAKGRSKMKAITFTGIKTDAAPENILSAANALSSLYKSPAVGITVNEASTLVAGGEQAV
jgi:hypothetical protein